MREMYEPHMTNGDVFNLTYILNLIYNLITVLRKCI